MPTRHRHRHRHRHCHRAAPRFYPLFTSAPPVSAAALLCLVIAISDGDTLTVRCGTPGAWRPQRVRVVAIDAPESRQAFGQRARQNLARLCFRQQAALRTLGHDDYGRTLPPSSAL